VILCSVADFVKAYDLDDEDDLKNTEVSFDSLSVLTWDRATSLRTRHQVIDILSLTEMTAFQRMVVCCDTISSSKAPTVTTAEVQLFCHTSLILLLAFGLHIAEVLTIIGFDIKLRLRAFCHHHTNTSSPERIRGCCSRFQCQSFWLSLTPYT
jgi:hypothetical protein